MKDRIRIHIYVQAFLKPLKMGNSTYCIRLSDEITDFGIEWGASKYDSGHYARIEVQTFFNKRLFAVQLRFTGTKAKQISQREPNGERIVTADLFVKTPKGVTVQWDKLNTYTINPEFDLVAQNFETEILK